MSGSLSYYQAMAAEEVDFSFDPEKSETDAQSWEMNDAMDRILVALLPRFGARRLYERARLLYEMTPQYTANLSFERAAVMAAQAETERQEEIRRRNRPAAGTPRRQNDLENARRLLGG